MRRQGAYAKGHKAEAKTSSWRTTASAGMTLLEMLGYIAILAIVINLSLKVFIASSRLTGLGTSAVDRLALVEEVRDDFTRIVRLSAGVVPAVGDYRSGENCLILEMPQDPARNEGRTYIIWGAIVQELRLTRMAVLEKDGEFTAESLVSYPRDFQAIRFSYDTPEAEKARLVTLGLSYGTSSAEDASSRTRSFSAAFRYWTSDE